MRTTTSATHSRFLKLFLFLTALSFAFLLPVVVKAATDEYGYTYKEINTDFSYSPVRSYSVSGGFDILVVDYNDGGMIYEIREHADTTGSLDLSTLSPYIKGFYYYIQADEILKNAPSLTNVKFSKDMEFPHQPLFSKCTQLKTVDCTDLSTDYMFWANFSYRGNEFFDTEEGLLRDTVIKFDNSNYLIAQDGAYLTIEDHVLTEIETGPSFRGALDIPANYSINKIGTYCAFGITIDSLTIPKGITEIASSAFNGSSLNSVSLPEGLISLGDYCFSGTNLKKVTIPSTVKSIGSSVFYGCNELSTITCKSKAKDLREFDLDSWYGLGFGSTLWFSGCKADVVFSSNDHFYYLDGFHIRVVKTTLKKAYRTTDFDNVSDLSIPKSWGIKSIYKKAFGGCSYITKLTLPEGLETIGSNAFWSSSITAVSLPSSLKSMGAYCFDSCDLKKVVIPNSVKTIGDNAFAYNAKLTQVTMPSNPTSLGNSLFSDCPKLKTITIPQARDIYTESEWIAGRWSTSPATLYVKKGSLSKYYEFFFSRTYSVTKSSKIDINKSSLILLPGDTDALWLNHTCHKVGTVKTSDKKVVTIDKDGVITAKKAGKATITLTYNKKKYTCKVTVLSRALKNRVKQLQKSYDFKNLSDYHVVRACFLWMRYNCNYDFTFTNYYEEGILLDRTGVCNSYMLATDYLLDAYNIPCEICVSDEMNHGWNYIKIGKNWFHYDATWNNFLMSDKEIQSPDTGWGSGCAKAGHYGYDKRHKCKTSGAKADKNYKSKR